MSKAIASDFVAVRKRTGSSFPRWFILSCGAILALTGTAKIWSGFGDSKILVVPDPIIGITFGHLMFGVGVVEIIIALTCCFQKRQLLALMMTGWIATNFLLYRLGLWSVGWHRPCKCLGNLTDALQISPQVADNIMKVVLAYLLIGCYGILIWEWKRKRRLTMES